MKSMAWTFDRVRVCVGILKAASIVGSGEARH